MPNWPMLPIATPRSSRGSGNETLSSRIVRGSTVASNRSRSQSRHSSTTTSGALAPAVTSTVFDAVEPRRVEVGRAVDQVRRHAALAGQLGQPLAVRAVLAAQHEHQVGLLGEHADGLLAVLRGVADVVLRRGGDLREPLLQPVDDAVGVVDAERRLREVGDLASRRPLAAVRRPRASRPGRSPPAPRPSCRSLRRALRGR